MDTIPTWFADGQWHMQVAGLVICADTIEALVDLLWRVTR